MLVALGRRPPTDDLGVADFLHAARIAVVGELPLERLRHALPPFPTRSEIWRSLLEQAVVWFRPAATLGPA